MQRDMSLTFTPVSSVPVSEGEDVTEHHVCHILGAAGECPLTLLCHFLPQELLRRCVQLQGKGYNMSRSCVVPNLRVL